MKLQIVKNSISTTQYKEGDLILVSDDSSFFYNITKGIIYRWEWGISSKWLNENLDVED